MKDVSSCLLGVFAFTARSTYTWIPKPAVGHSCWGPKEKADKLAWSLLSYSSPVGSQVTTDWEGDSWRLPGAPGEKEGDVSVYTNILWKLEKARNRKKPSHLTAKNEPRGITGVHRNSCPDVIKFFPLSICFQLHRTTLVKQALCRESYLDRTRVWSPWEVTTGKASEPQASSTISYEPHRCFLHWLSTILSWKQVSCQRILNSATTSLDSHQPGPLAFLFDFIKCSSKQGKRHSLSKKDSNSVICESVTGDDGHVCFERPRESDAFFFSAWESGCARRTGW